MTFSRRPEAGLRLYFVFIHSSGEVHGAVVSTLPKGAASRGNVTELDVDIPSELVRGTYSVEAALVGSSSSSATAAHVPVEAESADLDAVKPLSSGIYTSADGGAARWWVDHQGVLLWNGEPFIPVGGMFCSSHVISWSGNDEQDAKHLEIDESSLRRFASNGVRDLYVNNLDGGGAPVEAWQSIVDALERNGFRYGIQLNAFRGPGTLGAYVVRAAANGPAVAADVQPDGSFVLEIPSEALREAASLKGALYVVLDKATGAVVDVGEVRAPESKKIVSKLSGRTSVPSQAGFEIRAVIRVDFSSNPLPDMWSPLDATIARVDAILRHVKFGPGLRFIVDPIANEIGIVNALESAIPDSDAYRRSFSEWITRRHGTPAAVSAAWGIEPAVSTIDEAASMVPAAESGGYLLLVHHGGASASRVPVSSTFWDDVLEHRSESFASRRDEVVEAAREAIDVPVIHKHVGTAKRYAVNGSRSRGADGVGGEIYGTDPQARYRKCADAWSHTRSAARTQWRVVTETGRFEDMDAMVRSGAPAYPDEKSFRSHMDGLLDAGAKGIYDFLLKGHEKDPRTAAYDYLEHPEKVGWLAQYGKDATSLQSEIATIQDGAHLNRGIIYPPGRCWWYTPDERSAVATVSEIPRAGSVHALKIWWLPSFSFVPGQQPTIVALWAPPATHVWGPALGSLDDLKRGPAPTILLGLRTDIGAIPAIDGYYSSQVVEEGAGRVQVILPPEGSEVLARTQDGQPWALRDGNLWLLASDRWLEDGTGAIELSGLEKFGIVV